MQSLFLQKPAKVLDHNGRGKKRGERETRADGSALFPTSTTKDWERRDGRQRKKKKKRERKKASSRFRL